MRAAGPKPRPALPSTFFAIKQIAHGPAPRGVYLILRPAFDRVERMFDNRLLGLRLAATWTAIGEAGLVGPQLKFSRADDANLDWK